MISGTFTGQSITDSSILTNNPGLIGTRKELKGISQGNLLAGFSIFSQILKNLIAGNQVSAGESQSIHISEAVINEMNNIFQGSVQALSVNLNYPKRLKIDKIPHDEKDFSGKTILSCKLFPSSIKEMDKKFLILNEASGKENKQTIHIDVKGTGGLKEAVTANVGEGSVKTDDILRATKDPSEMNITKPSEINEQGGLLSERISALKDGNLENNKTAMNLSGDAEPDILKSKNQNNKAIGGHGNISGDEKELIINKEQINNEREHLTARKDSLQRTEIIRAKEDDLGFYQNGENKVNLRVEDNINAQRHITSDYGLKRIQQIEAIKEHPRPQSINLVVESDGLGKLALRVAVNNHLVRADFVADQINSLLQIQSNLSDLFSSLYREGLMPEDFSFYLGQNSNGKHKEQYKTNDLDVVANRASNLKESQIKQFYSLSIKV